MRNIETYITQLNNNIDLDDIKKLNSIFDCIHPVETAKILCAISNSQKLNQIISHIISNVNPNITLYLPYRICKRIILLCKDDQIETFLKSMKNKYVLKIIDDFSQKKILDYLSASYASQINWRLSYNHDAVGRIANKPAYINSNYTAKQAKDKLKDLIIYNSYPVCNDNNKICGSMLIKDLLSIKDDEQIRYDKDNIPTILDTENYMQANDKMLSTNGLLYVVRKNQDLVGILTEGEIFSAISDDLEDDIFNMNVGSNNESDTDLPFSKSVYNRFFWILLTMSNAILTSIAISMFDDILISYPAIPIVMPIVAAMGGTTGAQTVTVTVRALATNTLNKNNQFKMMKREGLISSAIGIMSGILLSVIISIWHWDIYLGLILGISVFLNVCCAGILGSLIVILLNTFKYDPAAGASPMVCVLTDIIGYISFLALIDIFLL